MEIWRVCKQFPRYEISNYGNFRSILKKKNKEVISGKVSLKDQRGKSVRVSLGKMVYLAFIGDIPNGYVVHHINFNDKDNYLSNLELRTRSEIQLLYIGTHDYKRHKINRGGYWCVEKKKYYKNLKEVAKDLYISESTASRYARGEITDPAYTIIKMSYEQYQKKRDRAEHIGSQMIPKKLNNSNKNDSII